MNVCSVALFCLTMLGAGHAVQAQKYEVNKNAHSHNDYLQNRPFYAAHDHNFASIEIDVFLEGEELYVAHDRKDIDPKRTIESLYIAPLLKQIRLNGNKKAYKEGGNLQFLIDLKTAAEPTLRCLEAKLKPIRHYFDVNNNPNAVRLVISGAMPPADQFKNFDEIFFFDGRQQVSYTNEQLKRIAFFSAGFGGFSKWKGLGQMIAADSIKTKTFVDSVHRVGKPVRFWGNPDTKTCWQTFIKMGVDYLNTDSPAEMARFLSDYKP